MPLAIRILLCALLLGSLVGCATHSEYWASRALDLWDVVPVSVQKGAGVSVSARISPFAQSGIGWYYSDAAYGMAVGRWGPYWYENGMHVALMSLEFLYQETAHEQWPPGPDGRYQWEDSETIQRCSGNTLVFLPTEVHSHSGFTWATLPEPYAWADSEIHFFLGVAGVRVGLSPFQLIDFVLGWFGLDPSSDDLAEEEAGEIEANEDDDARGPPRPSPLRLDSRLRRIRSNDYAEPQRGPSCLAAT